MLRSKTVRYFLFLIVGIGLVCLPACIGDAASKPTAQAYHNAAATDPRVQRLVAEYRRFFQSAMENGGPPGAAVVIVQGDSIVFQQGFGLRVAGSRDSVDIHTVFRVGSLSKGFAGILTGLLVQQGTLGWHDRVQECFPEFTLRDRKQARRIELWHLLSHSTGLPYHAFTNLIERGFDIRKIVTEYFPTAPVSGQEGVFFSYQNAAFCAIEEVMKGHTDKPYPELLRELVFQPAGMLHASCDYQSMQQQPNKCLPHFWTGYNWRSEAVSPLYYNAAAAGGVNASIGDMGEWLKLLMGHKPGIIADSTLDQVFQPVIKTGKERRIFPGWIDRDEAAYAMGWRVLEHQGETIIYHGGYVNGYRGEIAFNRRDDIGICVLMNASTDLSSRCVPTFFQEWEKVKTGAGF